MQVIDSFSSKFIVIRTLVQCHCNVSRHGNQCSRWYPVPNFSVIESGRLQNYKISSKSIFALIGRSVHGFLNPCSVQNLNKNWPLLSLILPKSVVQQHKPKVYPVWITDSSVILTHWQLVQEIRDWHHQGPIMLGGLCPWITMTIPEWCAMVRNTV